MLGCLYIDEEATYAQIQPTVLPFFWQKAAKLTTRYFRSRMKCSKDLKEEHRSHAEMAIFKLFFCLYSK